ncbi:MAG: MBL fold metallo-hydrolase [Dehalococcoidia bacterium]
MGRWLRIGDIELLVVSDGVLRQDAGAVFGLVPRIMWERYVPKLDDKYRLPLGLNMLVVRSGGKTILVDTGCGDKGSKTPGAVSTAEGGKLVENLAAEGIQPTDIDVVANTHLHFDHAGGNTATVDGRIVPTFPNARYLIQEGEWQAATHPNERTRGTYLEENLAPIEDAKQLDLVRGEVEITGGVRMVPAPGHTEDHCVVEIESGGNYAIYVGEMAQQPVMLERLAWVSAFDILPMVSIETKRRFTEKAIEKRALVIAVHSDYPGLGHLTAADSKRRWEPVE